MSRNRDCPHHFDQDFNFEIDAIEFDLAIQELNSQQNSLEMVGNNNLRQEQDEQQDRIVNIISNQASVNYNALPLASEQDEVLPISPTNLPQTYIYSYPNKKRKYKKYSKPTKFFYADKTPVINFEIEQKKHGEYYIIENSKEVPVYPDRAFEPLQFKFEDGSDVAPNAQIRTVGKASTAKHFTDIIDENGQSKEEQVFSDSALYARRLKFKDGTDVTRGAQIRIEGQGKNIKRFTTITNTQGKLEEVRVYTAVALSRSQLKFKDGLEVPQTAQIRTEGQGSRVKYYTNITRPDGKSEEVQVYTALALTRSRLKFYDGSDVEPSAQIRTVVRGNNTEYFTNIIDEKGQSKEVQIFTIRALDDRRFKFSGGYDVPPNFHVWTEGKGGATKHFTHVMN